MQIETALHGKRITIRNYQVSDLAFVTDMWFDAETGKYLSDPDREHVDEVFQKALDEMQDSKFGYYLVIELTDSRERIGSCCLFPDGSGTTCDIGYCIHKQYLKQGYGTETVALLLDWLKEEGFSAVTAEVAVENEASCALLWKSGFAVEQESEFQKYKMDVHYKSLIFRKCL